jgi:hypothetical protein
LCPYVIKQVKNGDGCLVKLVLKETNKNWSEPKTKKKRKMTTLKTLKENMPSWFSVCTYSE